MLPSPRPITMVHTPIHWPVPEHNHRCNVPTAQPRRFKRSSTVEDDRTASAEWPVTDCLWWTARYVVLPNLPNVATRLATMDANALLTVLLPVVAGALIGFVPNLVLEGRKDRAARLNRWSDALYSASAELMESARRVEHLAEYTELGLADEGARLRLDEDHQRMRAAREKISMLGNAEVQQAAREVIDHVYAIRMRLETGHDPHPRGALSPTARLRVARTEYYRTVRRQLRVPNPEEVSIRSRDEPTSASGSDSDESSR